MRYDDLTIQKLRELPIFDVCTKLGITLYGMGSLTKRAQCWYHDDQHPSMHVNKKKNIYKCFVCGKGGDVLRLVQDYENLSFVEACEWLVKEFHVTEVRCKKEEGRCTTSAIRHQTADITPLETALVAQSMGVNSEFCRAVVSVGYLTEAQMMQTAERYRLGMTKDGSVIFWEIDQEGRCRNGKMMHYQTNCHRDKQRTPTWAVAELKKAGKLPSDFENPHCLFGLHLMMEEGRRKREDGRKIAIVESEKTAVIMSEIVPEVVWLSCGGLQMLKPELLAPLVGYKVILFPDTDEKGDTYKAWLDVAQEAQKLYRFQYPLRISRLLELHATAEQKARKIDIVDFLFEGCKPGELCVQTP